jgi:hypothetical protein|tara:strand:- start:2 stop:280 length:279 start_codon:yes stop_codon:yes gene_type:complete
MFKWAQKRTNYWSKIRKKAPKVPDITCPDIDKVLNICEKAIDSKLTETKYKRIEKIMERLRRDNESLRESGVYWHHTCKDTVRDLLGKKKSR